jgi:Fe-S-cluster containining protein
MTDAITPDEYVRWVETRAGIPAHPALAPVDDDRRLARAWGDGAFRCESHRCAKVCCTGWPADAGIRLNLLDLVRLHAAGLLASVRGAFTPSSRDQPRLRSVDGHCVHYDPAARRCTIWEHRPTICRTYPFAIAYTVDTGRIEFGYAGGCSLTPGGRAALWDDPARPPRALTVRGAEPDQRAADLPPYERSHLEACVEAANELERTWRVVADAPELIAELGLEGYLDGEG